MHRKKNCTCASVSESQHAAEISASFQIVMCSQPKVSVIFMIFFSNSFFLCQTVSLPLPFLHLHFSKILTTIFNWWISGLKSTKGGVYVSGAKMLWYIYIIFHFCVPFPKSVYNAFITHFSASLILLITNKICISLVKKKKEILSILL